MQPKLRHITIGRLANITPGCACSSALPISFSATFFLYAIPILKKIIVASGNKVSIGNNLQEAINNLFTDYSVEISTEDSDDVEFF